MQDELAKSIKTSNPGTRVLEYRIDDAVSYDPVVHKKMLGDPAAFVRWHHKPHNNGSICENWDVGAFVDPTRINNPKNNCSFHISSSAYDYTQPAVRTWYLDNIIKPTIQFGDGAWLDGDGPDNGAWMCTAGTHGNLRNNSKNGYTKISALNDSEAQAYTTAKLLVTSQAREWLIAQKGFEYTCFHFVSDTGQLPVVGDSASVCSSKIRALNSSRVWPSSGGGSYRPATVYYGSRVGSGCYDSATVDQAAAVFMLTRHQHDLFHLPHNMSLTDAEARTLLRDDGAPLGGMLEPTTGVFERRFEKATVRLDCATFTAQFLPAAEHGAVHPQKLDDDEGSVHKGAAVAAVPFQVSLVDKTIYRLKLDDEDGAASIDGDSPLLDWQGRVDRSVLGRTGFDWVGTSFSLRLKGASVLRATFDCALKPPNAGKIRVFLHDDNDHGTTGKPQTYPWPASEHHLPGGNNTVVLAAGAGLSRTAVVTVFQNNNHEGSVGSRSISLVALETDGVFLPAVDSSKPQPKQRRITFIGDSITAATNNRRPYGDLSINGADGPIPFLAGAPTCADWTGLQGDYTLTYQAALCRNISNSNCTTVAVGGKGMYRNCCDPGPLWMPEYYQKLGMGDTGSTYTFPAEDAPDAVIINLGTNDFSGDSWRKSSDFQQAFTATYVEFMVNVTRWWKKNDIAYFLGVGPIQNEYLNATLAAVAGGKARGLRVHFLDQMGPPRDGCAGHPGIGGHAGMASMALEPLITTMGWKTDDLRAASPDPLSPVMRAQLATYLRRVNAWVAESGVGNNNLSCGTMKDAIFINGNLARGLMAGFESLSNRTQLDIGLQWCDELVKLAYNSTSSDGSVALYWDTGYRAMFFGDTGTAMQALATGYRLAAKGSGGAATAQARRTKYMWAMTGYLNYVTKGCAQAPQIPGFAYGNQTSKGWVNKDGSLGDGYCPPKGSGICFASYSCATATTGAGAFGALAALSGSNEASQASAASVAQGAGRFLAGEVRCVCSRHVPLC